MGMPVMGIGKMGMIVLDRRVQVGVVMTRSGRDSGIMLVCVMFIAHAVGVLVRVLEHFMRMPMFVSLRQM